MTAAAGRGGLARRLYLANGFMQGLSIGAFMLAAVVWWVVDLGLSPLRLTLLGTIMAVAVLLAESPTGVVADVFSRKWSIVLSWLIIGTAQLLAPISELLILLLTWQALWGVGYTFQTGADTAWVTDELGEEDDALVIRKAIALAVGIVVGVLASMALAQWSLAGAMAASGLTAIGFAGLLALVMPEEHFTPVDRTERSTSRAMADTWLAGLRTVWRGRTLRIVVIATFLVAMVDETVDRLDFLRVRELGFPDLDGADSAALFGSIWVVMTLLALPPMVLVARRFEESSDRRSAIVMTGSLALAALGVGAMAGSVFVLAIVGWAVREVMREIVDPIGEAWVNRHAESATRATVISFRSQSIAFGEIGGGLLMGTIAEVVSLAAAFATAAVLLAVAAGLVGRLLADRTPATV